MTKFVVFGDSWPYGAELFNNEESFGKIIAKNKNWNFQCCAEPETAIDSMVLQLNNFIANNDTSSSIALFCLTSPSRNLFFDPLPRTMTVMWDGSVKPEKNISAECYYKHIHSTQLDYFRLVQTIIVLQKLCKEYSIKDYYISSFVPVNWDLLDLRGIDRNKFYNTGNTTFLDFFGCMYIDPTNEYFIGKQGHPNYKGHKLIAEKLSPWIN